MMLSKSVYWFVKILAKIMIPTFGRFEVVGVENIPKAGAIIIAPNHIGWADPPMLFLAIRRKLQFMAKAELFTNSLASWFLSSVHVFPVPKDRSTDAVSWAISQLNQRSAIVLFPEGTRNPSGLKQASSGVAYLAYKTGAEIIPIGITGTEKMHNPIRLFFPLCKIRIVIGKPFTVPKLNNKNARRQELNAWTDNLMGKIAELLPAEYQGNYAKNPP